MAWDWEAQHHAAASAILSGGAYTAGGSTNFDGDILDAPVDIDTLEPSVDPNNPRVVAWWRVEEDGDPMPTFGSADETARPIRLVVEILRQADARPEPTNTLASEIRTTLAATPSSGNVTFIPKLAPALRDEGSSAGWQTDSLYVPGFGGVG